MTISELKTQFTNQTNLDATKDNALSIVNDTTTVTYHDSEKGWLSEALSRPMTEMERKAADHADSVTPDDELFTNSHLQRVKQFIFNSDEPENVIKPFSVNTMLSAVIPLSQTIVKAIIT